MSDERWYESFEGVVRELRRQKVRLDAGLSLSEIAEVESRWGFTFPPDLAAFLQIALPASNGFPNWRLEDSDALRGRLSWPLEGICFDIEHNGFWLVEWGRRPDDLSEAFEVARARVDAAPLLIPVYSHRYLPASPSSAGNPMFSVYQTDIICYGRDLLDYFRHEWSGPGGTDRPEPDWADYREIEFWSRLVDGAGQLPRDA